MTDLKVTIIPDSITSFHVREAASVLGWLGDKPGISERDYRKAVNDLRKHGLTELANYLEDLKDREGCLDFLVNYVWG